MTSGTSLREIIAPRENVPSIPDFPDEPTNYLDLATKEMLVDALKDFERTMIFAARPQFLRGLGSRVAGGPYLASIL